YVDNTAVDEAAGDSEFTLTDIDANHDVRVTFYDTTLSATLSALTSNLALSITDPDVEPALVGNARTIQIINTGPGTANNVYVISTDFPVGTSIPDTCSGATLDDGETCTITITPGSTASSTEHGLPCSTPPGRTPIPTVVN